jgi:glycosyltransferase involved in cell wall biosynthesis
MKLEDVSVILTSQDDAETIRKSLESVRMFGELVVVDAFSTDGTAQLVREFPAAIYQRALVSRADQKNWALSRAKSDWVLSLDASEVVSEELRDEISHADNDGTKGFSVRLENEYLGRVMRSAAASGGSSVRLFARGHGRFVPDFRDWSRVTVELDGTSASIGNGALRRKEFRDLQLHLAAINRDTTEEALRYVDGGGRLALLRMLLQPPLRFWRLFLLRLDVRDGARGLMFCLLSAYAVFITYAKAWEYRRQKLRARAMEKKKKKEKKKGA